jgi:hypothetical protein
MIFIIAKRLLFLAEQVARPKCLRCLRMACRGEASCEDGYAVQKYEI